MGAREWAGGVEVLAGLMGVAELSIVCRRTPTLC